MPRFASHPMHHIRHRHPLADESTVYWRVPVACSMALSRQSSRVCPAGAAGACVPGFEKQGHGPAQPDEGER
eukprot:7520737-Prorocentrum_lima.AAC.1